VLVLGGRHFEMAFAVDAEVPVAPFTDAVQGRSVLDRPVLHGHRRGFLSRPEPAVAGSLFIGFFALGTKGNCDPGRSRPGAAGPGPPEARSRREQGMLGISSGPV